MPVGSIALLIAIVLVYFGVAHRVLDRMRLTDRQALLILLALIVGSFIDFTLLTRPIELMVNVGGAIVPIALTVWLLATADSPAEKVRGTVAIFVTGAAIYALAKIIPPEPTDNPFLDPSYVFAGVAGVVGYLAGRSRRSAFIAGMMGIVLADLAQMTENLIAGIAARTWLGGAGVFDTVILAGLLAVVLAEVVGETTERLVRTGQEPSETSRRDANKEGDGTS